MLNPKLLVPTPGCLIFLYDKVNRRFKTAHYTSSMTQGRASSKEIESILKEISVPIARWNDEYEDIYETKGAYGCLFVITLLLLPLFFFYICWLSAKKIDAKNKLVKIREEAKKIIEEKESVFSDKGLKWNIPQNFPDNIELWIPSGGPQMIVVQQPSPAYFGVNIGMPTQGRYSTVSSPLYQQNHVNGTPTQSRYSTVSSASTLSSPTYQRGYVTFQGMQHGDKMIMTPDQQQQQQQEAYAYV